MPKNRKLKNEERRRQRLEKKDQQRADNSVAEDMAIDAMVRQSIETFGPRYAYKPTLAESKYSPGFETLHVEWHPLAEITCQFVSRTS